MNQPILFEKLKPGLQADGKSVLDDLGWSSFHIIQKLGIESYIGVAGFDSLQDFSERIRGLVGAGLKDWEVCCVDLFRCWFAPMSDDMNQSSTSAFCYAGWRITPDPDAIKTSKIRVFALRHKAWPVLQERRVTAFYCARQRSYAEEAWNITHHGEPITPQIMRGFSDTGTYLTGIMPGNKSEERLTWPNASLVDTILSVNNFADQGARDIHLWGNGMGLAFNEFSPAEVASLLQQARYCGDEIPLVDIARQAGII